MNSKLSVAIYVRVSTQDQSCELQKSELTRYVESRGWVIFKIYEDKATGTNGNRPMLKALLKEARERQFDVLVCWKLDRLFRSLKDLIATLQELTEIKIDFISLKDNIDLTTSSGRLMMHLLGAFAEFEASLIRERVRAGMANAKARGKRLGRRPEIDSKRVVELRNQGMSLSSIAKELGVTKGAVSKCLSKLRLNNGLNNRGSIQLTKSGETVE